MVIDDEAPPSAISAVQNCHCSHASADLKNYAVPLTECLAKATILDHSSRETLQTLQDEILKTFVRLPEGETCEVSRKNARRNAVTPMSETEYSAGHQNHEQSSVIHKRRQIKLIAVYPSTVFSERESSKTVLEFLCGTGFAMMWRKYDSLLITKARPSLLLAAHTAAGFCYGLKALKHDYDAAIVQGLRWMLSILSALFTFIMLLWRLDRANAKLFSLVCRTFDYGFLLCELALLSVSYWVVFDFDGPVGLSAVMGILICFLVFAVDVYPSEERTTATTASVMLWLAMFTTLFVCLSSNLLSPTHYYLNLASGLTTQSNTKFSISVTDFCLSKLINVIILSCRVLYHATKHKEDFALIRSRVRQVD